MIDRRNSQGSIGVINAVMPPTLGIARARRQRAAAEPANSIAIWLILIGLIIPAAEVQLFIGGAKFTAGRLGIALLLVPALMALFKPSRTLVVSDLFACATVAWIITAASSIGESTTLSSAASESLEFLGGYVAARGFIYGPAAIREFVRILKILAIIALLFAISETLSGRLLVHEIAAAIFNVEPPDAQYRGGMVRAMATFDHAILYGAFCCFTGIILLYASSSALKRIIYVALCFLGCVLSRSSSALLSLSIAIAAYSYDRTMQQYPWRWIVLWALVAASALGLFVASANPLGWFLSHLTLDPESGYFRVMIWQAAFERISQSPLIGYGFNSLDSAILDATVNSVWLVFALRFGIPMIALLFITNLAALLPVSRGVSVSSRDVTMDRFSTAFTMTLVLFIFIGLTVHFWNYMWMFWGICIGIRASIREWAFKNPAQHARNSAALTTARARGPRSVILAP